MANNPFSIQADIGFDETQAGKSLETVLKKLKEGYKLKLSLDIGDLDKINRQLGGVSKELNKTFNLDTGQATESLKNMNEEMNRVDKRELKFVDDKQVEYVENIRKNLIETQKVVEEIKDGKVKSTKTTISEDYVKAHNELKKLQKQEFDIKGKMIGKDKEQTGELQKQLNVVQQYQSEIKNLTSSYNVNGKESFDKDLLREKTVLQSKLNMKQTEYINKQQEEKNNTSLMLDIYKRTKMAQVEVFKSQNKDGGFDSNKLEKLSGDISNINANNLKDFKNQTKEIDSAFKEIQSKAKIHSIDIKDTERIYKEMTNLQKDEFKIKRDLIGVDEKKKSELQKQLEIVREYQKEVSKIMNKYDIPNKQNFDKDLLREKNIEQSKLNVKQNEYNQQIKEEAIEVQKRTVSYQKEKLAKIEVFKSQNKDNSLYDADKLNKLSESVSNIKVDNLKDFKDQAKELDSVFKEIQLSTKVQNVDVKNTGDAYKELTKLQKDEFRIKRDSVGADKEKKVELQKQLEIVRERQKEMGKTVVKYDTSNKEDFNKDLLKERNIEQSKLNIKQNEYNQRLKEETLEVKRQIENYQKEKMAQVEVMKNRYKGLYDKNSTNELEKNIKNISADNLKDVKKEFQGINSEFKKVESNARISSKAIKSTQKDAISATEMIGNSIKKFTMWLVAGNISMMAMRFFKNGVKYVYDLNNALTEISVVTGRSQAQVQGLADSYGNLAKSLSVAKTETISSAIEFYRQGLSQNEVMERVATTTKFAKISNLDFRESAELLTATINSMGKDIGNVTDVFIALGDATSTSSQELAKGFQKAGGVAGAMNVEFEKVSSWLATISSRTRESAESIGTGVKTMMARYQQLTEKGFIEEDGTKVNNVAKALNEAGIKMVNDATGQFRNYGDVMDELGGKWSTLDGRTQAYISNAMAGTYQLSRFTNLMEGYSDSIDLYETALNSAGTTQKKYNLWLQGTEAYWNRVKEQVSDIWTKIFESRHLKVVLTLLENVFKTINFIIERLGSIPTLMAISVGLFSTLSKSFRVEKVGGYIQFLNENIIGFNKQLVTTKTNINGINQYSAKMKDVFTLFGGSFNGNFLSKGIDVISTKLMKLQMRTGLASVAFKKAKAESGLLSGAMAFLGVAIDTTATKTRLMTLATKLAKVGVAGFQLALTLGLSMALGKIMEELDKFIHKNERLKESLGELEQNVKNNVESNTKNIQTLTGLADEYDKLSGNTALTTEEQKRLYEIQNEIASISPEVVTGYDTQGNAIINLTGGVEGLIETLKEKNRIEQLSLVSTWTQKQSLLEKDIEKENKKIKKLTKEREEAIKQIEKASKRAENGEGINKGSEKTLEKWKGKLVEVNAEIEKSNLEIKNINSQAVSTANAMLNGIDGYEELDNGIKKIISSLMKAKGINFNQSDADKFVKMFSDKKVSDTIKQLQNLKANPDSVKDFNKELEKTVKTLAKLIEHLSGGKIKLDLKDILFAFDLKPIEDGVDGVEEQIKAFKEARDDLKEYAEYIKEMNEQGYLSADSIASIIEKHEELIPYLLDEGAMHDKLIELQNKEKDNAVKAIIAKLETNEVFFKNVLKRSPELVDKLKKAYGKDLKNFETVSEAKENINNLLIQTMGNQWSILYGTDIEALETFISNYERVQENLKDGSLSKGLLDTETYSKENYDKAKSSLDLAKEIKRVTDEAKDKLNEYNLGLDENTKATNKAEYATDAYANSMKALKTQLDELNSSMSKLYKNSWDYVKSLDKKRDLIKEQIKLTEQEIKQNNQLAGSYTSVEKAQNHSASKTSLDQRLQGVLKGHGQDYINAGNKYGIDPYLLSAISMSESGRGTSSAVKNNNNPSGIMDWNNNWKTIKHFESLAEGIDFSAKNLKSLYFDKGLTTIDQIGSKYAPIGASNDPNNLNRNWIPTVKSIYKELSGGGYSGGSSNQSETTSPEEVSDKAWNKAQDLKQSLIQLRDEYEKLNFEKYTSTIGILDDKIKRTNVNSEIYKDRAEKWSTNLVDNFKDFDNYIAEIQSKNNVLLEKQKYMQNEIWYGSYNSDQLVNMRFELQNTVGEIEKMTKTLQDAFQAKWEFKFQYDDRYFKEFDDDIDKLQDRIDLLNENDTLYEKEKAKLLSKKVSEQEKYIIYIQKSRIEALAERDILQKNTWEWTILNNKAKEYEDKIREVAKSMKQNSEELKSTLNSELDNLKSTEQKIIEIIKKRYETELEDYKKMNDEKKKSEDKRHKDLIDKLNAEKKAREEIIKIKLKDIDKDEEQNDYEKQLNKLIDEKLKLQYQYNSWSLVDTVEGRAKKESLREQIDKKQEEIEDYRHKRSVDLRKQNLNDSLEDITKEYEEKNKSENEKYESTKERLDKELKDTEEHYKKLTQKENLYAEARKAIFRNQIKYINGEMMNLTDAILKYEDEWGEGLSILGTKIKSDLIDNLQKAIDTAKNLDGILNKIKEIEKPQTSNSNISPNVREKAYAQSDSNTKINDFITAKKHLQKLGYDVIDVTKLSKDELDSISLSENDVVVGNALSDKSLNGAKRLQGSDRYDTENMVKSYSNYEQKVIAGDVKEIKNTVYGWGTDLKNAEKWLSAMGYEFVDSKSISPEQLEDMLKSGDIVLGETGVSPISDDILRMIGAVRLGGGTSQETLERIMGWARYGGVPQFKDGGVMDYTGLAMVHGSGSSSEVAFNSEQAKKLYNMVNNLPDSSSIQSMLPKINSNALKSLAKIAMTQNKGIIKIDNLVNIEGNADEDIVPKIERVAKTSVLKELRKACNKKGIYK